MVAVVFLRRQRHLPDPLIDVQLFRVPAFSVALLAYTLGFFVNFGSLLFVAQYLQLVLGQPPFAAGAWTVPAAVGFIVGSLLTPPLLRSLRSGTLVASGLLLAAVGFAVLTQVDSATGLASLVVGSVVVSLGLAPVFAVTTDLVVSAAPPERAGAASALSETGSEFGGALGIAILGTLGAAVYRVQISGAIPGDIPETAATAARDTLAAATTTAGGLPGSVATELLDAARAAFVTGFHAAAAASIAVLVIAALLTRRYLRAPQRPGPSDHHDEPDLAGPVRCRQEATR